MKNKKRLFTAILLTLTILLSVCLGVRVLRTDRNGWRRYESIEARAAQALKYAGRKGMSTKYCVFVDYGVPSGSPRVFVWSFAEGRIHSSRWVDRNTWRRYIPLNGRCCLGCVTVSSKDMRFIGHLVEKEDRNLLLWSYCETA